jgi:hypothetical protein
MLDFWAFLKPVYWSKGMPLTSEQIEILVHTVLHGPAVDRPSALFDLVGAVSDPGGDASRYEYAETAMRAIDPQTKEYEAWFQGRIAVAVGQRLRPNVTA